MNKPPRFESRRQNDFEQELLERARAWLPEWQPRTGQGDFLGALFKIASRFASEVAQRIDRMPEKNYRGFLHWLGIHGDAARAARVPAVFTLSAGSEAVHATELVQFQALDVDPPVTFETEQGLTITPAALKVVVGADASHDFYATAPQEVLSPLEPLTSKQKTFAPFAQFGDAASVYINEQKHEIYIGASTALDIPSKAIIRIEGWDGLVSNPSLTWWHSIAPTDGSEANWKPMQFQAGEAGAYLLKRDGAIDEVPVNGIKSRWLRATHAPLANEGWQSLPAQPLPDARLLLNCIPEKARETSDLTTFLTTQPAKRIALEGIANIEPLVLDAPFFPLGRQPRQFDSFYLGSKELFSKQHARVVLEFTMGDDWAGALEAVTTASGKQVVAGLSADGFLRVVIIDTTPALPATTFLAPTAPSSASNTLTLDSTVRISMAVLGESVYVCAKGKDGSYWMWSLAKLDAPTPDPWKSLHAVAPRAGNGTAPVLSEPVLWTTAAELDVLVLVDGKPFICDAAGTRPWAAMTAENPLGTPIDLAHIAVFQASAAAATSGTLPSTELVGVSTGGDLYLYDPVHQWQKVREAPSGISVSAPVLAMRETASTVFVWTALAGDETAGTKPRLLAISIDTSSTPEADVDVSADVMVVGRPVSIAGGSGARVAFVAKTGVGMQPGYWDAFAAGNEPPFLANIPSDKGAATGEAVRLGAWIALAGKFGHLCLVRLEPTRHTRENSASVQVALLVPNGTVPAGSGWHVIELPADESGVRRVRSTRNVVALVDGRQALLVPRMPQPVQGSIPIVTYTDSAVSFKAEASSTRTLEVDAADAPDKGTLLRVKWTEGTTNHARMREVTDVRPILGDPTRQVITLNTALPGTAAHLTCVELEEDQRVTAVVRPAVKVNDATLAASAAFVFPGRLPSLQRPMPSTAGAPWYVLQDAWVTPPPSGENIALLLEGVFAQFEQGVTAPAHNPELSWEYWDGNGWWTISSVEDNTQHLVRSGTVSFCAPAVKDTDVLGRKNFWVRARLVGGDYGQESISIVTTEGPTNDVPAKKKTEQVVERSMAAIRAPFVVTLVTRYSVCCPIVPEHVLAHDGGNFVDRRADKVRNASTMVSIKPLFESLEGTSPGATTSIAQRAIYLGFQPDISGKSLSFLFLVEETTALTAELSDAFPLRVEAHGARGFEPVISADDTRALSQSGTLKVTLDVPPVKTTLFGKPLSWLRIRPSAGATVQRWNPAIRAAYVNATWARATETQTNEILGSSDGRPNLAVNLARTPVVEASLRLRVRERLSESETTALLETDPDAVLERVGDRPGPWVAWTQKADLLDARADERAYTLEDAEGTVTFGDGIHGMIPPVGRDCILAERYVRGGGQASNQVRAFSAANLITPLAGVERVTLPIDAAGGSDPDDATRTLRFAPARVGQRERVLTLADLEIAALESSSDIVQAFARSRAGGAEVFIVMRGSEPRPSAAVRRELERQLRERAMPSLAEGDALRVLPPMQKPIRVLIDARVEEIDDADSVASACVSRVRALLDSEKGGIEGRGWPLGRLPSLAELAACLDGVPGMTELVSADLVGEDGLVIDAAASVKPEQLTVLMANGVKVSLRPESFP